VHMHSSYCPPHTDRELLHVRLHRERHQIRLICLRRAAHISAERLISVQTDEQTEIDMETNMDVDIGDKSMYVYTGLLPSTYQSINKS